MQATVWMASLQQQLHVLQQAQAPVPPPPPPPMSPPVPPQLMQLVIQLQQQQMQQQLVPPPLVAPAAPHHIKAALPTKFNGSPSRASTFMNACKNYFILNPMTQEQQVQFTLALMEGRADHWTHMSLDLLNSLLPPAWENDWQLFKQYFNLRFQD
jgi:hypothetical protein